MKRKQPLNLTYFYSVSYDKNGNLSFLKTRSTVGGYENSRVIPPPLVLKDLTIRDKLLYVKRHTLLNSYKCIQQEISLL